MGTISIEDIARTREELHRLSRIYTDIKLEVLTNEPLNSLMENHLKRREMYKTQDGLALVECWAWQPNRWEDPTYLKRMDITFGCEEDRDLEKIEDIIARYPKTAPRPLEPYQF